MKGRAEQDWGQGEVSVIQPPQGLGPASGLAANRALSHPALNLYPQALLSHGKGMTLDVGLSATGQQSWWQYPRLPHCGVVLFSHGWARTLMCRQRLGAVA